jgi:hypothetical protein
MSSTSSESPSVGRTSTFKAVERFVRDKPIMTKKFENKGFTHVCVIISHGSIVDKAMGQFRAAGSKEPKFMFVSMVDMIFPVQYGAFAFVNHSVFKEFEDASRQSSNADGTACPISDPSSEISGADLMGKLHKLKSTTALRSYDEGDCIPNQEIFTAGEVEINSLRKRMPGGMFLVNVGTGCVEEMTIDERNYKNLMECPEIREMLQVKSMPPNIERASHKRSVNLAPEYVTTDDGAVTLAHLFDKKKGTFKNVTEVLDPKMKLAVAVFTCRSGIHGMYDKEWPVASPEPFDYRIELDPHQRSDVSIEPPPAKRHAFGDFSPNLEEELGFHNGFGEFSPRAYGADLWNGGKGKNGKKPNRHHATKKHRNRRNVTKKHRNRK